MSLTVTKSKNLLRCFVNSAGVALDALGFRLVVELEALHMEDNTAADGFDIVDDCNRLACYMDLNAIRNHLPSVGLEETRTT